MKTLQYCLLLFLCRFQYTQAQPVIKSIIAANVHEIYQALDIAHKRKGYTNILIKNGTYKLPSTLVIREPAITLTSLSGQRDKVILTGNGMKPGTGVDNLIYVSAAHFTLSGITLEQAGNHLIQISGSDNADYFSLSNCVLRDAYEQLLKVSFGGAISADYGVVENCIFKYTAGIGPQWYIGGIDAHGAKYWKVKNNIFNDIASPENKIAEHAIHFWNGSSQNVIEHNIIFECDRGIGFGMGKKGNQGGAISKNIIIHTKKYNRIADVGIILENSPDTLIDRNYIYLSHAYPNAIEYRFIETKAVVIQRNITNKKITSRDGGEAWLSQNSVNQPREKVLPKHIEAIIKKR